MTASVSLQHRFRNGLHAVLLLAGMGALLGAVGWFVAGNTGVAGVLVIGITFLFFSPRISPRLILRMYGARPLDPAEAPGLFRIVHALARRAELPVLPRLFYIPSALLNAFSVGRQEEAVIALTDGLVRNLTRRELVGVLAHEMSHVRANDIWIMGMADSIGRLVWLGSLFGQALLIVNLPIWLMGAEPMPWLPIILLMAAPTVSALLQLGLSRTREFDADLTAIELTDDPGGLAMALDKLEAAHQGMFERIFLPRGRASQPSLLRTHPATEERIERLKALAAEREQSRHAPPRYEPERDTDAAFLPQHWPMVTRHPSRRWHGMWW